MSDDKPIHPGVKHAAHVGLAALQGFRKAAIPARIAARVPYIGPVLGLAVMVGSTVAAAVAGHNDHQG